MDKRIIICLGRQHGSGGREVGRKLAEALGIEFYDKRLLEEVASVEDINLKQIEQLDETTLSIGSLGFPMGLRNPYIPEYDAGFYVLSDRIYQAIAKQIRLAADRGSCVIVGRVASEILKDDPDMISVYIHASEESKIKRLVETLEVSERDARRIMKRTDRNREHYHNYYGSLKWGEAASHDISISTSRFGIDGTVSRLARMLTGEVQTEEDQAEEQNLLR